VKPKTSGPFKKRDGKKHATVLRYFGTVNGGKGFADLQHKAHRPGSNGIPMADHHYKITGIR